MGKEISLKETNNHAKLDLLQAKKTFPTPQSEHQENWSREGGISTLCTY